MINCSEAYNTTNGCQNRLRSYSYYFLLVKHRGPSPISYFLVSLRRHRQGASSAVVTYQVTMSFLRQKVRKFGRLRLISRTRHECGIRIFIEIGAARLERSIVTAGSSTRNSRMSLLTTDPVLALKAFLELPKNPFAWRWLSRAVGQHSTSDMLVAENQLSRGYSPIRCWAQRTLYTHNPFSLTRHTGTYSATITGLSVSHSEATSHATCLSVQRCRSRSS